MKKWNLESEEFSQNTKLSEATKIKIEILGRDIDWILSKIGKVFITEDQKHALYREADADAKQILKLSHYI